MTVLNSLIILRFAFWCKILNSTAYCCVVGRFFMRYLNVRIKREHELVTSVALVWETVEEELKKSALNLRQHVIFTVC